MNTLILLLLAGVCAMAYGIEERGFLFGGGGGSASNVAGNAANAVNGAVDSAKATAGIFGIFGKIKDFFGGIFGKLMGKPTVQQDDWPELD